jgi:3-hydroxyisobutyrate dehydrogenase-like beta-hydroxyacid dehydrogenase
MKVGFIGLGRMGQAMAGRLISAGYELLLYNRTPEKMSALITQGAHAAGSIGDAARSSGPVITMLADDPALTAVVYGSHGVIAALPPGGIHIAMGTHDVQFIRELGRAHAQAGQMLVSAPVLGRPDMVASGRATLLAAGQERAIERCLPLLEAIGPRVIRLGADPASAAALKLANNFLLACAIEALGEAFALVDKSGVDRQVFHDLIAQGLFASPAYTIYAKIIADKAWGTAGFTATLALKDVSLALAAAKACGVPLPSGELCRERLQSAIDHGNGNYDWSVMALEQARASGLS